jgi:16S rRNA (cytosine1402-N4)-methyltransferase
MEETSLQPTVHVPVLSQEVIDLLQIAKDDVVVDCTVGGGGHAALVLELLGSHGRYLGIDADSAALERVGAQVADDKRVTLLHGNFRDITELVTGATDARPTKILADLGFSSDQLAYSGRGFSIDKDEPLLMTYTEDIRPETLTAWHVVNEWSEASLADVIYGYGGETRARKIAHALVTEREAKPITTSGELAHIVQGVFPKRPSRIHPATKTFQAVRMAVNDELGSLESLLSQAYQLLAPKGRIAVISFHSLEDRVVKHVFRNIARAKQGILLVDKPITPTEDELKDNRRARSAKLRALEKRIPVD